MVFQFFTPGFQFGPLSGEVCRNLGFFGSRGCLSLRYLCVDIVLNGLNLLFGALEIGVKLSLALRSF